MVSRALRYKKVEVGNLYDVMKDADILPSCGRTFKLLTVHVLTSIVNREFRTIIHLNNKSMRVAVFLKTFVTHEFIFQL